MNKKSDDEAMMGIEFPKLHDEQVDARSTAIIAGKEVEIVEDERGKQLSKGTTNVLLVAGSRDITDVWREIGWAAAILDYPIDLVIHGGARGIDQTADYWAKMKGYDVREYLAQWDKLGKRAGYVRNGEMVQLADSAIIIWDGESKGTAHTLKLVQEKGIPYVLVKL